MPAKTKGFRTVTGKAPKIAIKKGSTKACGHAGCKVVLRYTANGTWVHGVRNWDYDHEPVG